MQIIFKYFTALFPVHGVKTLKVQMFTFSLNVTEPKTTEPNIYDRT